MENKEQLLTAIITAIILKEKNIKFTNDKRLICKL